MTALNRHRPAVAFILVTAALDVMAMGLVIPVLPILIEEFAGSISSAGWWNGVMVALWALMQFVFSPIIGSLSDRFGRRPVILISIFGLAVDWVLMALAPNLWWLAAGRIIGGITSSSFTAVYAYLADIIPPEGRAKAYGLVGAAFSAGFIAGPALGGVLGEWGPRTPFWVAAALSGIAFLYGLFVLPESLPKERRMAFAWSRANPLGAVRLLRRHAELTGLAWVYFLLYFAHHVFSAVFVLYAAHRYGFGPLETGLLLAFAGLLEMLVQIFLVGRVSGWLFVAALVPNALWSLALPTIQSLMTRLVSEREQGQLQGANNSVASVAGVISPLFFGAVYGVSVGFAPGLVFVIAAVVLLGGAAIGHFAGKAGPPALPS